MPSKLLQFHSDPEAHKSRVQFTYRYDGLISRHECERAAAPERPFRTACALRIRNKTIAGAWKLNDEGTHWTFYASSYVPPKEIAAVPTHEVFWAHSPTDIEGGADFATYGLGTITYWRTIAEQQQCEHCDEMFEAAPARGHNYCPTCWDHAQHLPSILGMTDWAHPARVKKRIHLHQADAVRWLRQFISKGHFTKKEFRELCVNYNNVCLCCGASGSLVADHVIPLERGGSDDITNIQPLCRPCNRQKGTESTDYRPHI